MRSWIKKSLIGLFGASVVLGGLTACGHQRHGPGMHASAEESALWRAKMVDRVSDKLDLTAEQKGRLTVLGDKLHAQRLALRGTTDPRAAAQALVAGDKFDRAGAQALVGEKASAFQSASPEIIAAAADFYDSLNAQQQQKVRDFMQRRGGRWQRG